MALLQREDVQLAVVSKLKSLGYTYITLDLAGFRSGSLNEILNK
jgi:uncharacterized protein